MRENFLRAVLGNKAWVLHLAAFFAIRLFTLTDKQTANAISITEFLPRPASLTKRGPASLNTHDCLVSPIPTILDQISTWSS